jgi:hypothetical protein
VRESDRVLTGRPRLAAGSAIDVPLVRISDERR